MITRENYEEYMMMHADGELSPAEEQALMSFLYEHPELQHELTAFSMTKLIPNDDLVYTRKVTLLKPAGGAAVVPFAPWKKYAVAAGVAAILLFGTYRIVYNEVRHTPDIAATTDVPTSHTPATTVPAQQVAAATPAAGNTATEPATIKEEAHTGTQVPATHRAIAQAHQLTSTLNAAVANQNMGEKNNRNRQELAAIEKPINQVKPAEMIAWENNTKNLTPVVTNVPPAAIYVYEDNEETKQSIVEKLPIDELKKEGMENVVTAMANGYDKINAIKKELSETVVSFKIEKRKLVVSF